MSFDEYYASIFDGLDVEACHTLTGTELQHSQYKGSRFEINLHTIELFDGIRLDFGRYNGDFRDFLRKVPHEEVLHFGYCLAGGYEGLVESKIPFCLGISDIWCCSMCNTIHTTAPVQCQTIGFSIAITEAKNEIGKFLRHCDIVRLHDYLLDNPLCCPANKAMIKIFAKLQPHYNSDILRLSVLELLLVLDSIVRETPRHYQKPERRDYCRELHHFIQKHCHRDLGLEYLAKMYNISVAKLTRDFLRVYGISIYQFMKQCRMQRAYTLLISEDNNVSQVANEVGYVNVSAFCKNFKHSFGENPKTTLM
ncbi:AraC family transcriptional regulator, partial [Helicobacter sp. MIT 14-3879]|uniref:helix-turn-helix transcriptional regulator n=1 Tax=Helicobacter sp. MIT 14-3879 TaxID=2040649 RepID=UPI000E39C8DE